MAAATATAANPLGVALSPYWPHPPSPRQYVFLALPHLEALYGGAAGGGKTDALLMGALQHVHVPGYSALLVRRTYKQLARSGQLLDLSRKWLARTPAKWHEQESKWVFPSGATISFGHLDSDRDLEDFYGPTYQYIGVDEATQFPEKHYRLFFSRLRRTKDVPVPIRLRAASNPGGVGHDLIRDRFGIYRNDGDSSGAPYVCHRDDWPHDRAFVPARLTDNPALDTDQYLRSMEELDHHTRRQLRDGDWDSRPSGDLFRKDWFETVDSVPDGCKWVRYWDQAATEPSDANPDPDWTVGLRLGRHPNGTYYIEDIARLRERPQGVELAARGTADRDGPSTAVWLEEEPGSSGKAIVDHWVRDVLPDRAVKGLRSTGSKADRARVVSSKAEHGLIKLKRGRWNRAFLDELEAFTITDDHAHDDQVDGLSGAYQAHAGGGALTMESRLPSHRPAVVNRGDLTLVGDHYIDKK